MRHDEDELGVIRCDIRMCARCDGNHEQLAFRKMNNPMDFGAGDDRAIYTHFALCPNTGQPVVLRQTVSAA